MPKRQTLTPVLQGAVGDGDSLLIQFRMTADHGGGRPVGVGPTYFLDIPFSALLSDSISNGLNTAWERDQRQRKALQALADELDQAALPLFADQCARCGLPETAHPHGSGDGRHHYQVPNRH